MLLHTCKMSLYDNFVLIMNLLHTKNAFIRKAKKILWPILDDKQTDILTFTMSTVYQILNNYF